MLHQRYKRRVENYLSLTKDLSTESVDTKDTSINEVERGSVLRSNDSDAPRNRMSHTDTCSNSVTTPDIEDMYKTWDDDKEPRPNVLCNTSYACGMRERQQLEFLEFYNCIQSFRHTVLLILMLCSMFVVIHPYLTPQCQSIQVNFSHLLIVYFVIRVDTHHGRVIWYLHRAVISGSFPELWPEHASFNLLHHRHGRILENYRAVLAQSIAIQEK